MSHSMEVEYELLPDEGEALGPVPVVPPSIRSAAELYKNLPTDNEVAKKIGSAAIGVSLAL